MKDLLYDALMLGRNREVAREEYLTATNEKFQAKFKVKENSIELKAKPGGMACAVHLEIVTPGYFEIEVFSKDEILSFDKKVISSEDFEGDTLEFKINIVSSRLHDGKNFASIEFRTIYEKKVLPICVDNSIGIFAVKDRRKEILVSLASDYLELRQGRLFQKEWADKTDALLTDINGSDVEDLFLLLYKANLYISDGREAEAAEIVGFVAEQLRKLPYNEHELACYFLYVRSRLEMDETKMLQSIARIRAIYEENPSWRILWVLFYMDETYEMDPARKLAAIKDEFEKRGCVSPIMYYEAAEIYRRENDLINGVTDFELQVLWYAAKSDFLSSGMAITIAGNIWDLQETDILRINIKLAVRLLKSAYSSTGSNLVLKTLCKLLIAENAREKENHFYFKTAIDNFLEMPGIYYYYLLTADRSAPCDMHESIISHFLGRESELGRNKSFFFASLITYKHKNSDYYKEYAGTIERFAYEQIAAEKNDIFLSIIYEDLFKQKTIVPELTGKMLEILRNCRISFQCPDVTSVLIFHPELSGYQEIFRDGDEFYGKIYSDEAIVLFKDEAGNIYANIDHQVTELISDDELVRQCIRNSSINRNMLLPKNLPLLKEVRDSEEILGFLFEQMGSGSLRSYYEQGLLKDLIKYFTEHAKYEEVYEKLLHFMEFELEPETRGKLIEIMIEEHLYREAYDEIKKNGIAGLEMPAISRLAHVLVELSDYNGEELLNKLCSLSFHRAEFDPVIFRYLCVYYEGDRSTLLSIYKAANQKGLEISEVAERLLNMAMEELDTTQVVRDIFDTYYDKGADKDLKIDFISKYALRYLFEKDPECTFVFRYMETEAQEGTVFEHLVVIAFLLYKKDEDITDNRTLKYVESMITALTRHGIMLTEFKTYGRYFKLPPKLSNTYIAQIFSDPEKTDEASRVTTNTILEGAPIITFEISTRAGMIKGREAMNEVIPGCFVKYFELFFGESVDYSIEGGETYSMYYEDDQFADDGSRYSKINSLIRLQHAGDRVALHDAAVDLYKKDKLIEKLF